MLMRALYQLSFLELTLIKEYNALTHMRACKLMLCTAFLYVRTYVHTYSVASINCEHQLCMHTKSTSHISHIQDGSNMVKFSHHYICHTVQVIGMYITPGKAYICVSDSTCKYFSTGLAKFC